MKIFSLSFLAFCFFCLLVTGEYFVLAENMSATSINSLDAFSQANEAYYKNHLDDAAKLYQQLLDSGMVNGHLNYNLGNIAYRLGHMGTAVLHYKKALRLIPRDPDVRANLEFIERKLVDKFVPAWSTTLFSTLFFWNSYMTTHELLVLLAFISGGMWICGGLLWFVPKSLPRLLFMVLLILSVLFSISTFIKWDFEHRQWGIIEKVEVDVHPTFLETEKVLFKLHEGTEVEVIDRQSFEQNSIWLQIRLSHGESGWVKEEEVGIL